MEILMCSCIFPANISHLEAATLCPVAQQPPATCLSWGSSALQSIFRTDWLPPAKQKPHPCLTRLLLHPWFGEGLITVTCSAFDHKHWQPKGSLRYPAFLKGFLSRWWSCDCQAVASCKEAVYLHHSRPLQRLQLQHVTNQLHQFLSFLGYGILWIKLWGWQAHRYFDNLTMHRGNWVEPSLGPRLFGRCLLEGETTTCWEILEETMASLQDLHGFSGEFALKPIPGWVSR